MFILDGFPFFLLLKRSMVFKKKGEGKEVVWMCSVIPSSLFGWITCLETEVLMSDFEEGDIWHVLSSIFWF